MRTTRARAHVGAFKPTSNFFVFSFGNVHRCFSSWRRCSSGPRGSNKRFCVRVPCTTVHWFLRASERFACFPPSPVRPQKVRRRHFVFDGRRHPSAAASGLFFCSRAHTRRARLRGLSSPAGGSASSTRVTMRTIHITFGF